MEPSAFSCAKCPNSCATTNFRFASGENAQAHPPGVVDAHLSSGKRCFAVRLNCAQNCAPLHSLLSVQYRGSFGLAPAGKNPGLIQTPTSVLGTDGFEGLYTL